MVRAEKRAVSRGETYFFPLGNRKLGEEGAAM